MRHFGLIGYPLGHSFSKGYFNEKFEREQIDAVFNNYPIKHIAELKDTLTSVPAIEGLSVTIPYKEQVIPFLDSVSPVVLETGACNCIRIRNGELQGFNTDVIGFEQTLIKKLSPAHSEAFVLGTGGASKAVQFVLNKLGIRFTVISRKADPSKKTEGYGELTKERQEAVKLWINTTPLGMYPKTDEMPQMDYSVLGSSHYLYDLVYNPAETKFLKQGVAKGSITANGHDMLLLQAEAAWVIWNS